ncbi:GTP-binding protein [Clostridium sp. E02]|uniref:GTP-binding protein n=1 Tax=Clostridium sp. E02 TaxID=2487134 RepID=UPI000F530A2F|nr:GTP-binding protein [Clostridium sp. E02]
MTNLYIISGFLGAGKTTLIQTMVQTVFQNQKVVVIENDFGDASIDADLLRECSVTVSSLNAGCICCSMTGDFTRAIEQIVVDYEPDAIVVEPSGVGKLSDIIKSCDKQRKLVSLSRCITVVDAMKFDKYCENFGEIFINQIQYADLILLSHQKNEMGTIESTVLNIRKLNQEARIEADFWDSIPKSVFQQGERVSQVTKMLEETPAPKKFNRMIRFGGKGERFGYPKLHFAKDLFQSVTLICMEFLTEDELREKINRVIQNADGLILRGKGIVRGEKDNLSFHYIPGKLKIQSSRAKGGQICFIGTGISEEQIKLLFEGEL